LSAFVVNFDLISNGKSAVLKLGKCVGNALSALSKIL
jgi:hypothetical protein